jgi:hypothetical protein
MICVPGPKMCVYIDNVRKQKVFWISFVRFILQAKYETLCACSWWEIYRTLKYHVCRQNTVPLIQFSPCAISIHISVVNILWYRIGGVQSNQVSTCCLC